jgi:hypothetical protein
MYRYCCYSTADCDDASDRILKTIFELATGYQHLFFLIMRLREKCGSLEINVCCALVRRNRLP